MVRRTKKEITAPFLLTIATTILYISGASPSTFGMYEGMNWYARFTYQFLHISIWHLLINIWNLWGITTTYKIRIWHLVTAYLISASPFFYGDIPTVGLSGMCFSLMGIIWYQVLHTKLYHCWIIGFIFIGFLFPGTAARLHLYCYCIGFIIGWLNKPVKYETGD